MYDVCFFFFNDTATTEIYTLSLHDALPICLVERFGGFYGGKLNEFRVQASYRASPRLSIDTSATWDRSEEHTSELQSQSNLVCRLLLEKKNLMFDECPRADTTPPTY